MDVVGPDDPEAIVYLLLNRDDGRNDDYARDFGKQEGEECRKYLAGLSTFGRFLRFQQDFRRQEGYCLECNEELIAGKTYFRLRNRDACEFLSKKDYIDNWRSEMHETFCYWDFAQWRKAVERAGFAVHPESHAYANPWIVDNRYRGKAEIYQKTGDLLEPMAYPVTNMVLIAEKR